MAALNDNFKIIIEVILPEWILEEEKDFLESLKFAVREPSVEGEASEEELEEEDEEEDGEEDEEELEEEDEEKKMEDADKLRSQKRKQFDEVVLYKYKMTEKFA